MQQNYISVTREKIKRFYDRLGTRQDTQALYEEPAIRALVAQGHFKEAHAVLEFGVGTGRLAAHLLKDFLPHYSQYRGLDVSTTMVRLAEKRLANWIGQAAVALSDGSVYLPVEDGTYDRLLSTYVLEILSDHEIEALLGEAKRILTSDGLLCVVNLTFGQTWYTKVVSSLWKRLYRMRPMLVGGCRPIRLLDYLPSVQWHIQSHSLITAYGITSEVVVAKPLKPS